MTKRRSTSHDDVEMFRREMSDVTPLKDSGRAEPDRPKPEPRARQRARDERQVMRDLLHHPVDPAEMETGEELHFLRPGLQRRFLTRLKRGHYSIADSLDLHQMNAEAAQASILDFLDEAHARGFGCVRIIHGKGLRSRNGPVLKQVTKKLLSRHPMVAAFASCRPVDGGTGAVQVLLRRRGGRAT